MTNNSEKIIPCHPASKVPGNTQMLSLAAGRGRNKPAGDKEAGFTLIEMLVVLAIIGLLVSLVAPKVFNLLSNAKTKTARIQIESFVNGLDLFALDNGRYPTTAEGLKALYSKPPGASNWTGPYLRGNGVPQDPWGTPYIYRSPGQEQSPQTGAPNRYEIISLGSDRHEGGTGDAADIDSWKL